MSLAQLPVAAQRAPDAGTLMRDLGQPAPAAPPRPAQEAPAEASPPARQGPTVIVHEFRIRATLFPEETLKALLADYLDRPVTLGELDEAAIRIGRYYREHDLSARAYLPPQTISDGIVRIDVLEALLGGVVVDSASPARLDGELAAGLVAGRAEIGQPLHPSELQEGVAILNEVPGIAASAILRPGAAPGQTVADIRLADRPFLSGWIEADNDGVSASGERRGTANVALDDLLGRGERVSVLAAKTADSTYGRLALQMPAGISGLSLGIDGSGLTYSLGGPFAALGETGSAYTIGATAVYPIRRSPSFSLSAYGTLDYKRLVTRATAGTINDRIIIVGTAGLSASLPDDWLGGGTDTLGGALTAGNLDRGPNGDDLAADQATARSNGTYAKLSFNAARTQPLADGVALVLSVDGQAAVKNLDSSEQFSLGGPAGVRAYPVNEANGDDGLIASLEPRWAALDGLQLSAFYDFGLIRQHVRPYPGSQTVPGQPNAYPLQGVGAGVEWQPLAELDLKAVYAHAVGTNQGHEATGANSDGKHDRDDLWLQARLAF